MNDMQYFGDVEIGGQRLQAILDTGSFELVVFAKSCSSCGTAAEYDEWASPSFQSGDVSQVHSYGSGSCHATDGYDTVSIGTVMAERLPLWLAHRCQIPLLSHASFHAIAGIGPPGQPMITAQRQMKQLEEMEQRVRARGGAVPRQLQEQKSQAERALEAAKGKTSMLESFGVRTFSACLGRKPASPGYLVWHDRTRAGVSGVQRIPVSGNVTWGVSLSGLGLRHRRKTHIAGCERGCGAIVDTGTSLFGVPSPIYNAIASHIQKMGVPLDCYDLSRFPDLVMDLGGERLRFPPSSYLGGYAGRMDAEAGGFLRTEGFGGTGRMPCQLLMMDLGPVQQTTLGPMIVLGMPFFREYYTTFDLGRGRGDRSIYVSPASDSCEPDVGGLVASDRSRQSLRNTPRTVDLSTVRVPQWLRPGKDFEM